MGANAGKDFKRGLLAFATSGTSEIKTGGGQYGDETVADSLFPKTVNDWALEDRAAGRAGKDAATQTLIDKAASEAALSPDGTDAAVTAAKRQGATRNHGPKTRPRAAKKRRSGNST